MMNLIDQELMTPGSVWIRENGKSNKVLFVTNEALPVSMHEKHPQQVVYTDEEGNVFSVGINTFLAKRSFYNVDPTLESRLEKLLSDDDQEDDTLELDISEGDEDFGNVTTEVDTDEGDFSKSTDSIVVDSLATEVAAPTTDTSVTQPRIAAPAVEYIVSAESANLPMLIDPAVLSALTDSYQSEPMLEGGRIIHKLFIQCDPRISAEILSNSFFAPHGSKNAVFDFRVNSEFFPSGQEVIDWDLFVGVYPYVFQQASYYQVILATEVAVNYNSGEDPTPVAPISKEIANPQAVVVPVVPTAQVPATVLAAPQEQDQSLQVVTGYVQPVTLN